jgi:murein DD-endopeptidase MepM/ murein hydrolase activator NlpD
MRFSDRVTVLIIPRADARVISLRVSAGAIALTLALFVVGLISLGTSAFLYAGRLQRDHAIARLGTQNRALEAEIEQVKDSVVRLSGDLARLETLERDVRVMTDLPVVDPEVARLGVGGPAGIEGVAARTAAGAAGGAVTDLRRDVDALLRKAEFQRASLSEVASAMSSRRVVLSRIPSIMPVAAGRVTSPFGKRTDPFTEREGIHLGVDISGHRGQDVLATAAGRIVSTHARPGHGLTVEIDHENGFRTIYSHNSKVFVRPGQRVERGDTIAAVGNTGRATAAHCHYEVHQNGAPVNPEKFILSSNVVYD